MTKARPWPQNADHARVDSIAAARAINKQVMSMQAALEKGLTISSLELSIRLTRINNETHKIIQSLVVTGPMTFKKE